MVLSLLPAQVVAQGLTHSPHAGGQDAAMQSIATQNIGPNEAEVANDLYEKKFAQVSTITLISDIELNGCFPIDWEVTIDLNGHVLKMSDIGDGSVLKVENGGHLTIIDSNPTAEHKFTPNADGLWVLDETNGTKTVKGGVIYGGTGSSIGISVYGGGVYVEGGGTFTMNGGNIVGCTASTTFQARGGGVFVAEKGTFTMSGGSIAGCTTVGGYSYGGGIYNEGTVKLSGAAEIRDCYAKDSDGDAAYGGGISDNGEAFQISGNVRITGCTASGGGTDAVSMSYRSSISGGTFDGLAHNTGTISGGTFNGRVVNSNMITDGIFNGEVVNDGTISGGTFNGVVTNYGTITEGAVSGITVTYKANGGIYATQIVPSGSAAIKPVDPTVSSGAAFLGWYRADGTAYDFTQTVTENIILTARFAVVTRKVETKEELTAALADDTVDVIKLGSDIAIDATLIVDRAVTLDLVGYMLEMKGSGSVITVKNGGHLTLVDSDLTSTYYFTPDADGLWKWGTSGTKTVLGGVIYGGKGLTDRNSNGYGGGVYVDGGGAFTMNGGNIVGCKAVGYIAFGGGMFVAKGGTFTMTGGSITGCTAVAQGYGMAFGGGIRNDGESNDSNVGRTALSGTAVIRDCHAKGVTVANQLYGGGISDAGTLTISGDVQIIGCTADGYGSDAMYVNANNDSSVTGGMFYGSVDDPGNKISGLIVTYKDGDNEYAKQVLPSGTLATRPDTPANPGYIFEGWYTSDGAQWDYATAVTENLTLTAKWTIKTREVSTAQELTDALADISVGKILLTADIDISSSLTILRKVTLDLNGYVLRYADTTVNGSVFKIVSGGDLTVIDSRPDAEHRFNSDNVLWVLDEQNGKEIVKGGIITGGTGTPCYEDGSPYFTARGGGVYLEGDARFTMNGGNIVGCIAHTGGGVYISENGSFTMNGGSIVGCSSWFLSGPGGTPYFGGVCLDRGTFTMTGGVIKNCAKYSVVLSENATMNANGGEIYGVVKVEKNSYVTCLDGLTGVTAFRDNFWIYHNSARVDWGLFYDSITNYYSDPIIGLTVTYMNGETVYAKQILPSGTLATRPDALDPRTGYTFGGWNKADGTAWDYASDKVTDNITLYAKWIANTYTVTFDTAGGSTIAPITQDYGTAITAPEAPIREGYTFIGWDKAIPATMPAENVTITAQWEINQYTITFDTAGGSTVAPITQDFGTAITAPEAPTREGYTFIGWDKQIPATMPAENMTITAQWEINQYTITFDTAGGSTVAPITQDFGTAITAPANPTKVGYTFTGWDKEIPATMPAENITITAQWTLCDHVASTAQPTCTASATCTECSATLAALGHDVKPGYVYGGDNHWKECTRCTDKLELEAHAGGAASCTEQSVCSTCGQSYGALKPGSHSGSLVWHSNITMHEHRYDCCGLVVTAYELHHWYDGKCADCGYICTHPKGEKSCDGQAHCNICGSDYAAAPGSHAGKLVWVTDGRTHEQRYDCCGTVVTPAAAHEWKDGRCTVCGEVCGHTGGKANCHTKATCTVCGEQYGETDKSVHDGGTEVRGARAAGCTAAGYTGDTHCKSCGGKISSGTDIPATGHTGGKATCVRGAVCEVCGNAYGEIDPKNHASALVRVPATAATVAAEGNVEHWRCPDCGALFADADGARGLEPGDVVTGKLAPSVRVSESDGEPWVKGSGESLKFEFGCDPDDILSVHISVRLVPIVVDANRDETSFRLPGEGEVDYIRREDGVTVVLTPERLDELEPGIYDLTVDLGDGLSIGTSFTVEAAPTNAALVITIVAAAVVVVGGGAAASVILIRRKKH